MNRVARVIDPLTKKQIALSSVGGTRVVHVGLADLVSESAISLPLSFPPPPLSLFHPSSCRIKHPGPFSMAFASTVVMVLPTIGNRRPLAGSDAFSNPSRAAVTLARPRGCLEVRASVMNDKAVAGLTAAAVTAALLIPDIAEAAQPGISPSLKNFLLSIVSGGVVLGVIAGAVVGVANFDPVKRS